MMMNDDDDAFLSADTKSVIQTHKFCTTQVDTNVENSKQTLALRQASEESACFLLSFFCDD